MTGATPAVDVELVRARAPSIRLMSPANGATVAGTLSVTAHTQGGVARVDFYSDAGRVGSDTTPPWQVSYDTTRVANGSRTFGACAYGSSGATASMCAPQAVVTIANAVPIATPTPAPTATPTSTPTSTLTPTPAATPPPSPPSTTWDFSFPKLGNATDSAVFRYGFDGSINFGGPLAYPTETTYYPYEHMQVVPGGVNGHPAAIHPSGRVARFDLTAADIWAGRKHSKVYKYFDILAGISGTYRAKLWLPTDFSITQGAGLLVNVFQFKDGQGLNGGASTPRFELGLQPAGFVGVSHPSGRSDAPVAIIRHDQDWNHPDTESGYNNWHGPQTPRPVPLGQPVEFRAEVYQGNRVDFYLNAQFVGSVAHSHRSFGGTATYNRSFIWGVGHYSSDPGYLYVLDADYTKR